MAETAFAALQSLFGSLGLASSPEKDSPSATKKVCLGIHVNTDDLTLRVPDSRLLDLLDELRLWSSPEYFTIKELQSLLGKLSIVPACVRSSRNSLSRLLDAFRIFPSSVYVTHQPVRPEMRQDLAWCPVATLQSHFRFNSGRGHAPLFSVICPTSRRLFPITYSHFCSFLSITISAIVLVPAHYSPLSFRGGASSAFKCNVPAQLIQRQGDWERAAHLVYLEMSLEQKQLAVTTMADDILRLSPVCHFVVNSYFTMTS